ncbi:hypothetical protein PAMP_021694 [Pampus punctatissimus]
MFTRNTSAVAQLVTACETSRLASVRRLLNRMSRKQSELEGRLDDMLSRIAMETQEIKELEQQLTDGEERTDQLQSLFQTGAL